MEALIGRKKRLVLTRGGMLGVNSDNLLWNECMSA
jgi:hypothetical protein